MIKRLIDNIKNYIVYLENQGIYISIHTDFTEFMLPLLEYNIHRNPRCLLIKSDNNAWESCIREHSNEFSKTLKTVTRTCHAGVTETVFFLSSGGTVCASSDKIIPDLETLVNPLCRMLEYLKSITPDVKGEITENEVINKAIKFVDRNFYNNITNEQIAKVCSCSVSGLCHLFKKYKGTSIRKYISRLRISYAETLLTTTNLSVSAIASKSGFSDYNYFSAEFKKKTGLTPTECRKKAGT